MLRSDAFLEAEVAAELACDIACREAAIEIAVKHGVVMLSGTVANPALVGAAIRAAKRVYGVDGVDHHLELMPGAAPAASAVEGFAAH